MTGKSGSEKLWGGRFSGDLADLGLQFSESTTADRPMIDEDIWGSQVHCIMLGACGIISQGDLRAILGGLAQIRQQLTDEQFDLDPQLEDVHKPARATIRWSPTPAWPSGSQVMSQRCSATSSG